MTQAVTVSNRDQLERGIARGGMAQVYLARDQLLDRPVAIKVLFPEYARDPSFVERFRREAQAAANLNHPNIVAIYDWGQERGTYFIVMEYVEGRSLRDMIRADGPLPAAKAAEIGAEIAGALAFAHRNGVVHRDIKPGNVLMTTAGQVKVTDFGIARATRGDTQEALTQTGNVMGTATYFSPEQAQGLPVDGRSDVYSLGVVLYELLTGKPPFSGDNPVAVAYKHVREEPERPSQRVPDVAPDFEQIVMAAMTKDVDARYQSADDLRDDLVRFVRGRSPLAAPVTAVVAEATGPTAASTQAVAPVTDDYDDYDDGYRGRPPRRAGKIIGGFVAAIIGLLLIGVLGYILFGLDEEGGGGGTIDVPTVVGMTFPEAEAILVDEGFEVEQNFVSAPLLTDPPDVVLAQDPAEGGKLERGGTVTLDVPEPEVTVPDDLIGKQCTDVVAQLAEIGLNATCENQDSDQPPGTVLSTTPPAGAKIERDGPIQIFQATQPEIAIPPVENLPASDAKALLEQAGFVVTTQNEASTVTAGRATRTDPPAGALATSGDAVTLFISTGPEQVAVPNTEGQDEAAATNTLTQAGFNVTVQRQAGVPPDQVGKVISQSPNSGEADQGSQINIVVGQ